MADEHSHGAARAPIADDDVDVQGRDGVDDSTTTVAINIKTLNGPDFELTVAREIRVSELKTQVRERTNVDESRQRLIYRGKVLADTEPLSAYKVENGHFVHMVARPQGVPAPNPPSGVASSAHGEGSDRPRSVLRPRGMLGERYVSGLGVPLLAQGQGRGNGTAQAAARAGALRARAGLGGSGGGGIAAAADAENAHLNAAVGAEGGDVMSNILGMADRAGNGLASAGQTPQGTRAFWNPLEARGARGHGREAAVAAGAARAAAAAGANAGIRGTSGTGSQGDLEHVRQGLLTLHTLLSGATNRTRRSAASVGAWREGRGGDDAASTQQLPSLPTSSSASSETEEVAPAANVTATNAAEETASTREAEETAGAEDGAAAPESPTTRTPPAKGPETEEAGEAGKEEKRSRTASSAEPVACPDNTSAHSSSPRGIPWLPATFLDELDGGDGARVSREASRSLQSSPSGSAVASGRSWQYVRGEVTGSESSESPPQLFSSSGESDTNGVRGLNFGVTQSPDRFLRRSLSGSHALNAAHVDDDDHDEEEEEKDDTFSGEGSEQSTRKFFVGQWLDVKDTVDNWLEATIMDTAALGRRLKIHYNGWPARWDEWISWDSPRIAPFRTKTQHLPHAQHVSPAPVSTVRNAPITGTDDVRVVMPEVSRVLQEIGPMVDELSAFCERNLEQEPSDSPMGERAVSHTLPWVRQRVQQQSEQSFHGGIGGDAEEVTRDDRPKAAELAGDIAPLLDRLGRMLTDVAPHLARLSEGQDEESSPVSGAAAAARQDAEEPGEVSWGAMQRDVAARRSRAHRSRAGGGRSGASWRGESAAPPEETTAAFRQLVSTSSPAPTSSNINIHIHAIVPLRAPPSPPHPPPPPPPTASASAVVTPTRADRPPLAVAGIRNPPWGGNMDTVGLSASLSAAARAAAASRASALSRDSDRQDGVTPRRLSRGILAGQSARSGGVEADARAGIGAATGSSASRSASVASSMSSDVIGAAASPMNASTSGHSATIRSSPNSTQSSSGSVSGTGVTVSGSGHGETGNAFASSGEQGAGGAAHRRSGGAWRGFLRAFGIGGGGNSRVGGRREGAEGDHNT